MVGKKRENQEMLMNDKIVSHDLKEKSELASIGKVDTKKLKVTEPANAVASVEGDSPARRSDSESSQSMQQHHSDIEDGYKEFLDS